MLERRGNYVSMAYAGAQGARLNYNHTWLKLRLTLGGGGVGSARNHTSSQALGLGWEGEWLDQF